ncbi:MAG: DUF4384 domain-containing protein [Pseudomonadota bacterium]
MRPSARLASLLSVAVALAGCASAPPPAPTPPPPPAVQGPVQPGLDLQLLGGPRTRVGLGEPVRVAVSVERAASVYCYYEFNERHRRQIVRLYPNRFQPDPRLGSGRSVVVPGGDARFDVVPTGRGREKLVCVATLLDAPFPSVPAVARGPDLTPLKVRSATGAAFEHVILAPRSSSVRVLEWQVP